MPWRTTTLFDAKRSLRNLPKGRFEPFARSKFPKGNQSDKDSFFPLAPTEIGERGGDESPLCGVVHDLAAMSIIDAGLTIPGSGHSG